MTARVSDERETALSRTDSALLRAVEAEARRRERIRVADVLRDELGNTAGHDGKSTAGRLRYGLERALERLPLPDYTDDGPWTELVGSVCGGCDGIDVALHLDADEPDPMPYRLKVVDGAEDTVAYAYLAADEVDELIDCLQHARRRHRAWHEALPVHDAAGDAAGG